jgi:hypothetical protein
MDVRLVTGRADEDEETVTAEKFANRTRTRRRAGSPAFLPGAFGDELFQPGAPGRQAGGRSKVNLFRPARPSVPMIAPKTAPGSRARSFGRRPAPISAAPARSLSRARPLSAAGANLNGERGREAPPIAGSPATKEWNPRLRPRVSSGSPGSETATKWRPAFAAPRPSATH